MVAAEYLKQQPPVMKPGSTRRSIQQSRWEQLELVKDIIKDLLRLPVEAIPEIPHKIVERIVKFAIPIHENPFSFTLICQEVQLWVDPIFFKRCHLPVYSIHKPFDDNQLSPRLRRCLALAEELLLQGFHFFQLQAILGCCSNIITLTLIGFYEDFGISMDTLKVPLSLANVHCPLSIAFQTVENGDGPSLSPTPIFGDVLFTRLTSLSLDITKYEPEQWKCDYSHLNQLSSLWLWDVSHSNEDLSFFALFIKEGLLPCIPSNLDILAFGVGFHIPKEFKSLLDGSLHRKLVFLFCNAEYYHRDYPPTQKQMRNHPEVVEVGGMVHAAWKDKHVKQQVQEVISSRLEGL
ncbi:hypothetical protein DL96DRAFT_149707 [Flagelloscypha sp. PMI_526]|nr:hypothetical protein DL96DRAFT_149707 [Flagelloscypha sp. PMI_526]